MSTGKINKYEISAFNVMEDRLHAIERTELFDSDFITDYLPCFCEMITQKFFVMRIGSKSKDCPPRSLYSFRILQDGFVSFDK